MNEIQAEIQEIENKIQDLENTLDAIAPDNVLFPVLTLELQQLRDMLAPVKELAIKFDL